MPTHALQTGWQTSCQLRTPDNTQLTFGLRYLHTLETHHGKGVRAGELGRSGSTTVASQPPGSDQRDVYQVPLLGHAQPRRLVSAARAQ